MNMRYREVVDEVLSPYRHQLQENAFDTSRSIGKLLLQYEETDWEFLERVASHAGAVLTPDVAGHEARIWIGAPGRNGAAEAAGRDSLPDRTQGGRVFDRDRAPNERLQERSFTRCVVRLEQLLQLGDQVELNGIWLR
ncbi:hypothetical protein HMSSN036_66840 [Paenibacillus macerans]|nr:hypothetical protein HMSSN036_66840 [Paenibacillus macerans]